MPLRRIALLFTLAATVALAQPPTFEVASVEPVEPGYRLAAGLRGGPGTNSPGELSGTASMRQLLMRAYNIKAYQISGPAWMESERYEIVAKIPAGATPEQGRLMLQSLLADRFRLVVRRENRNLPVYALVVAKNGPKFHESPAADPENAPRTHETVAGGTDGVLYKHAARRETMQQLADRLSSQWNRPVLDQTGLTAYYDFTLSWAIEGAGIPRTDPPPDEIDMHNSPVMSEPGLSLANALQTQLGLRLVQTKAPLTMLIVEKVEKVPTGN